MTERRVSQRTGNPETCQREQEGEMEPQTAGGGRMGGDVNEAERSERKKLRCCCTEKKAYCTFEVHF